MNPPHIVIDARLFGLAHAGIGRYIHNLITHLSLLDHHTRYTLITSPTTQLPSLSRNFSSVSTPAKHYSLKEQLLIPQLLHHLQPNLVHFPHFNVPISLRIPFIVTIHDLLWSEKIGFQATTLNPLVYALKYVGYRLTIQNTITNSQAILAPTKFVQQKIAGHFPHSAIKIHVTPEAADQIYFTKPSRSKKILAQYHLTTPFIIYTGSLYPHKNINSVIDTLPRLDHFTLAIASSRNVFLERTQKYVKAKRLSPHVKFLGFVPDPDLVKLYHHALALIQPSLSEGFGLTGLEAMAAGLPVICSDINVMREVYGQSAVYTDTTSPSALASVINALATNPQRRSSIAQKSRTQAAKYSWKSLTQKTLSIYRSVLNQLQS